MVNYEVKGQLAKLLATEDLIIENRKVDTASFDVDRRILTLPLWEKASSIVYDLLVGHEVGHALFTPNENWKLKYPELPHNFVNILEDVRVERLIKRRFAGIHKTFFHGYAKLADDDFFGISETDIEDLTLADRLNLFFKIGNFEDIPFSGKEQYFVDRATQLETFSDVLELSRELWQHCKDSVESPNDLPPQQKVKAQQGDNTSEQSENIQPQSEPSQPQTQNSGEDGGDFSPGDWDELDELMEQNDEAQNNPQGGEKYDGLDTITDKNFADAVEDLNSENNHWRENAYLEIPQLKLDTVIATNSEVHEHIETFQKEFNDKCYVECDEDFAKFKRAAQKEVNYLVKEFECKKAADAYARATVSRTGVLNTGVLHTYKYNEDLFKKVTIVPDGKNHGLVFVLDWSGSMGDVLLDTIKQLYNLIWFCKKCSIPFDVYAFTNEWAKVTYDKENLNEYGHPIAIFPEEHHEERIHNELFVDRNFSLMNLLTSKVRGPVLEKQLKNLWRVAWGSDCGNRWKTQFQTPCRLALSGTPLNEALICMNQVIPDFKQRNGVQKVQCIVLTDGEAPPMKYTVVLPSNRNPEDTYTGSRPVYPERCFIRDRETGCQWKVEDGYHGSTETLLNQLGSRFTDTNFIGIRVLAPRDSNSFIRRYTDDYMEVEKLVAKWKKTKTVSLKGSGYDTYFGLSSTALSQDTDFFVKEDATKGQIKSAFVKSLRTKKMNKKILSEFVDLIA